MAETFEQFIERERERLTKEREEIFDQQHALEEKLQGITRELAAIDAYTSVKSGRAAPAAAPMRKPRATSTPTGRKPRESGKRAEVLDLIRRTPEGLTSAEIAERLNANDKTGKQSVANALTNLKNDGLISQAQRRGPYTIAPAPKE